MKRIIYEMTCYYCGIAHDTLNKKDNACQNCKNEMEINSIVESENEGRIRFLIGCEWCKHGIPETKKCYLGGIDKCNGKLFEKRNNGIA